MNHTTPTPFHHATPMPMNHMMLTPMNHMTSTLMNHTITMRHTRQCTIQRPGRHHADEPYDTTPMNHMTPCRWTIHPRLEIVRCSRQQTMIHHTTRCTIQRMPTHHTTMPMHYMTDADARTFLLPSAISSAFLVVCLIKNTCHILYRLNPDSGGNAKNSPRINWHVDPPPTTKGV